MCLWNKQNKLCIGVFVKGTECISSNYEFVLPFKKFDNKIYLFQVFVHYQILKVARYHLFIIFFWFWKSKEIP